MISVENLTKSFGDHILFKNVSFTHGRRERIGLVGRNGHGKTTLFRLVMGEDHADEGSVVVPKNYRIGHVKQTLEFTCNTILKEGLLALRPHEKHHHWKVEKILSGLGFRNEDMNRPPDEFSGGYQVRLNLAKVLISDPDMLLLDEPTNYLDIASIRWIEEYLASWPRELMLITHDRNFMDKVVTHIIGIHRKELRKITGNTERYYHQIAQDEHVYEKTRINDQRKRRDMELFINRFRAKARLANLVQSRIKTLSKMEKQEKLEKLKILDFSFRAKPFSGKNLMHVRNLSFSYESGPPLMEKLSFSVGPGDRIFIVGKNGRGKTTLIKLLAGMLNPLAGEVVYNLKTVKGYFEQSNVKNLVDDRTIEEEILFSHPDVERQLARNICGAMMFSGDTALNKISVLSGGEKSRVLLGKLLATPVNILLLDEPTNHLDMESCDALLAAIDAFEGAVLMVTHNEMFLHAMAQRLIVFRNDQAYLFNGTYQEFIEKEGWEEHSKIIHSNGKSKAPAPIKFNRKVIRQKRSELVKERSKILKPIELEINRTEEDIEIREKKIEAFGRAMLEASQNKDGKKIAEISQSIHACQVDIDRFFNNLERLTHMFEEKNELFERKLHKLEQTGY